jgi:hypothetical protein
MIAAFGDHPRQHGEEHDYGDRAREQHNQHDRNEDIEHVITLGTTNAKFQSASD